VDPQPTPLAHHHSSSHTRAAAHAASAAVCAGTSPHDTGDTSRSHRGQPGYGSHTPPAAAPSATSTNRAASSSPTAGTATTSACDGTGPEYPFASRDGTPVR